jgi:hypothetical protein
MVIKVASWAFKSYSRVAGTAARGIWETIRSLSGVISYTGRVVDLVTLIAPRLVCGKAYVAVSVLRYNVWESGCVNVLQL